MTFESFRTNLIAEIESELAVIDETQDYSHLLQLRAWLLTGTGSGGGGGSGDASAANQTTIISELQDIEADIANQETNFSNVISELQSIDTNSTNTVQELQDVEADIESFATANNTNLQTINTSLSSLSSESTLSSLNLVVAPPTILHTATGTINTSGDNLIVDISAVSDYVAGKSIAIVGLRLQNESGNATIITLANDAGGSATRTDLSRVYTDTLGSGIDRHYTLSRELKLPADTDLLLNLSAAETVGYSIEYYLF